MSRVSDVWGGSGGCSSSSSWFRSTTASGSKLLRFDKMERSARAFVEAIVLDQSEFGGKEEILDDNFL